MAIIEECHEIVQQHLPASGFSILLEAWIMTRRSISILISSLLLINAACLVYESYRLSRGFTPRSEASNSEWNPVEVNDGASVTIPDTFVGNTARFRVELKNESLESLLIRSPVASCECTSVQVDKTQLLPGEIAILSGSIRPASRPMRQAASVSMQVVGLRTSKTRSIAFDVSVNFKSSIEITNHISDHTTVETAEDASTGEITIRNLTEETLEVRAVSVDPAKTFLEPSHFSLRHGDSKAVRVKIRNGMPINSFVKILVNEGRESHLVPLKVGFKRYRAEPSTLILGALETEGGRYKSTFPTEISIKGYGLENRGLILVQYPSIFSSFSVIAKSENEACIRFEMTEAIDMNSDEAGGKIHVNVTDDSGRAVQSLEIPVMWFVR